MQVLSNKCSLYVDLRIYRLFAQKQAEARSLEANDWSEPRHRHRHRHRPGVRPTGRSGRNRTIVR